MCVCVRVYMPTALLSPQRSHRHHRADGDGGGGGGDDDDEEEDDGQDAIPGPLLAGISGQGTYIGTIEAQLSSSETPTVQRDDDGCDGDGGGGGSTSTSTGQPSI